MHTCHIFLFAAIQSHFMCRKKCRGNAQFIFKSVPGMQEQKRLSFLPLFLTIAALLLVLFCQEWIKSYISDFQCDQLKVSRVTSNLSPPNLKVLSWDWEFEKLSSHCFLRFFKRIRAIFKQRMIWWKFWWRIQKQVK